MTPNRNDGPSGLLLVDKPEGMTSHDVVDAVRRLLDTRRVGHAGTLDPAATGLLVLCIGKAGRLQSFLTGFDKSYDGTMKFGVETDTYDRDGAPVGTPHPDPRPSRAAVQASCARFTGELSQSPPPFSAKKFAGRKFYEMARQGEAVPDMPKRVVVSRFETASVEGDAAVFTVSCSSGTYIRSLVHEVGRDLGLGAHLTSLRRTAVGPFRLESAITLDALDSNPPDGRTSAPYWTRLSEIPLPFPTIPLAPGDGRKIRHGHSVPVRVPADAAGQDTARLLDDGELVAIAKLEPLGKGALALAKPKIVLEE